MTSEPSVSSDLRFSFSCVCILYLPQVDKCFEKFFHQYMYPLKDFCNNIV